MRPSHKHKFKQFVPVFAAAVDGIGEVDVAILGSPVKSSLLVIIITITFA